MAAVIDSITAAPAGTWNADPVHSHIAFEVTYAGTNTFRGGFDEFTATFSDGRLEGSTRAENIELKDEQLKGHLQTPDFFDAERFPEITFSSEDLKTGELTIKGVTRPVELSTTISAPNTDAFGRERFGLRLETTIDRNEFGVSWNAPNQGGGNYLGDDVKLVGELAFVKAEN
ncbi:MAG TPA: YceI family protein [Gaiellaceae bacterium]|nr:YceI family protein [Gaiellaceae bacterium]